MLYFMVGVLLPAARAAVQQPAPVSVDELERLVDTLQNDAGRARLVEELRALIAAQRGSATEKPAATAFLGELSQQVDAFTGEILAGVGMVVGMPNLFGLAQEQISDTAARRLWIDAATAFGLVF